MIDWIKHKSFWLFVRFDTPRAHTYNIDGDEMPAEVCADMGIFMRRLYLKRHNIWTILKFEFIYSNYEPTSTKNSHSKYRQNQMGRVLFSLRHATNVCWVCKYKHARECAITHGPILYSNNARIILLINLT